MKNEFRPVFRGYGRAIFVENDGTFYRAHHLNIFRSTDKGETWQRIVSIPRPLNRTMIEPFRLLCRLLRHEVRAFVPLKSGGYVAATRTGVFYARPEDYLMNKSKIENSVYPPQYPMTMCYDTSGRIIWGEYWYNAERRGVRLYASDDNGQSFHAVHTFEPGATRHVHNIIYDKYLNKFWVFTGDHETDPGIGMLDTDFSQFEWVHKGEQKYRAVWAFDLGDSMVYATDTEKESNAIYLLNKDTAKTEHLQDIDGSCIYATRFGKYYTISTTAEPINSNGKVKNPMSSSIWISDNAFDWKKVYTATKDLSASYWSYKYFQFGSIVLPAGKCEQNTFMFSGQALKGIDGKVYTMQL